MKKIAYRNKIWVCGPWVIKPGLFANLVPTMSLGNWVLITRDSS